MFPYFPKAAKVVQTWRRLPNPNYPAVENIYGSKKPIAKQECINHYQTRVGCTLRRLKKIQKGLGVEVN